MNPALAFILAALVLMGLVVGVLGVAMWRGSQRGAAQAQTRDDLAQANAQVYRDQLAELEREHAQGHVNDEEFAFARDELSQRLLEDVDQARDASLEPVADGVWHKPRVWLAALALCVPVGTVLMYSSLGQPAGMDPVALRQGVNRSDEVTPEKLTEMATALIRRLQDEPNSAEGWVMLGRVQRARARYDEADEAFRRALDLTQDDNLAIERAEVEAAKNRKDEAWITSDAVAPVERMTAPQRARSWVMNCVSSAGVLPTGVSTISASRSSPRNSAPPWRGGSATPPANRPANPPMRPRRTSRPSTAPATRTTWR